MKPPRFERRETPSPQPSFNVGWRLWVSFGAAILLILLGTVLAAIAEELLLG